MDGKDAYLKNLPHPEVEQLDNDHMCVSITECAKELLAFGSLVANLTVHDESEDVSSMCDSPKMQAILKRALAKYDGIVDANGKPITVVARIVLVLLGCCHGSAEHR